MGVGSRVRILEGTLLGVKRLWGVILRVFWGFFGEGLLEFVFGWDLAGFWWVDLMVMVGSMAAKSPQSTRWTGR